MGVVVGFTISRKESLPVRNHRRRTYSSWLSVGDVGWVKSHAVDMVGCDCRCGRGSSVHGGLGFRGWLPTTNSGGRLGIRHMDGRSLDN